MILLDTDVLIDVALGRSPDSRGLLRRLEAAPRMAFVAWHSLSNFYYVVRPMRGVGEVEQFLLDLTGFVAVAPSSTDAFRFAARLPLADFEDAMQVAAARSCGASVIASRNVRDYVSSPIPAKTPTELLAELW